MATATTEIATLNSEERSALRRCEKVIDQNREAFLKVGNALLEIRESRLYRETHDSFNGYVEERHDFKGAWASRLIQTAQVSETLSRTLGTKATPIRLSPDAAATLAKLPKDQQSDAYRDAADEADKGRPTIKAIKAKVDTYLADTQDDPRRPGARPFVLVRRDARELAEVAIELLRAVAVGTSDDARAAIRQRAVRVLLRLGVLNEHLDADLMNALDPHERLAIRSA